MKKLLILFLSLVAYTSYGQLSSVPYQFEFSKVVNADYAEQDPIFNWDWGPNSKQQVQGQPPKYMMITGPNNTATPYNVPSGNTQWLKVTQGQYGAPAPLFGNTMWKAKVINQGGANRVEPYSGQGCGVVSGARWWMVGIYLPTSWVDDWRPSGIAFDFKHWNAVGPASAYLKVEDGFFQWNTQYPQGSSEVKANVAATQKNVWHYFVVNRNFSDGPDGYIRLYYWKQGTTPTFTLVDQRLGANYNMGCGATTTEGYWLPAGPYNWKWNNNNTDEGGPGPAGTNDSTVIYYDNLVVLNGNASLQDFNNFISGATAPPGNQNPIVNGGGPYSVTLPTTSTTITGTASDPDGTIASTVWSKLSGPTGGAITSPSSLSTDITGLQAGEYVYQLLATDNLGATSTSTATIFVSAAPPTGDPYFSAPSTTSPLAVRDTIIQGPVDSISFTAWSSATSGKWIQQMLVTQIGTSPTTLDFVYVEQNSLSGNPTFLNYRIKKSGGGTLNTGTYTLRFTTEDNAALITADTATVTIAVNTPPTVSAGADQFMVVDDYGPNQIKSTFLYGTSSDADGTITNRNWGVLNGPENYTIVNADEDTANMSSLVAGAYTLEFSVRDDLNARSADTMVIYVLTANAGPDTILSYPVPTAPLFGTASIGKSVDSVRWSIEQGSGTITNPTSLTTASISGVSPGTRTSLILTIYYNGGFVARSRKEIFANSSGNTQNFIIIP